MEFLRGVLGLIGVGCAYMAGRSAAALRKGWQKKSRLYGWIARTAACLIAMAVRHPVDIAEITVCALAAAACALAFRSTMRERPPEDLTRVIFPDEP